jgi:hypothetical protein
VSLPGGVAAAGVPTFVGADEFTQALAIVGAAGAALAPLAPIFTLIDAVLSVKEFAESVPGVVTNPGGVVTAIGKLAQKIGRLASVVPQLSIPVLAVDVIDTLIALLGGLVVQLNAIVIQSERIASALETAATLPPGARGSLETIAAQSTAANDVQRANLQHAITSANPIFAILNLFVSLIGIPGVELSLDLTAGSPQDAIAALNQAIAVLRQFRRAIPI